MKLSKRTNTIILWIIAIALTVGMIVMFTPTIGNLGGGQRDTSTPALLVNGEAITELEVARAQQGGLYSRVREGEAAEDLELLLLDQLIQQEVLAQAASRVRVSGGDVRQAVNDFREQNGVAGRNNDEAYLALIGRVGFTDQDFRAYLREQLRLEEYQRQLIEDASVTDEEVEAFYQLNRDEYRQDERILARMIVVDDLELAADLRAQAAGGADFAELAQEHSLERADRGGALGAPADSSEPQPVGRAALPNEVAAAAFGLQGPGLTEVVEAGSRAYVVQVEEHIPADTQPLDEVRAQVEEDALAAKQGRILEDHIDELRAEATISSPEGSQYAFEDDVVARVGDSEIMESDLVRATYTNPQIQQALGPQNADLIAQFFKPTILAQLIDRKLAYLGAQELDAEFIGSEGLVAQEALAWVSRDVTATEEELRAFYDASQQRFTLPAEADATQVTFDALDPAEAFRSALLAGAEVAAAAEEFGGSLEELGTVFAGDLDDALDTALFGTDAFDSLPDSERSVSDVLVIEEPAPAAEVDAETDDTPAEGGDGEADPATEDDAAAEDGEGTSEALNDAATGADDAAAATVERFVVLVAIRTPERVRPFDEVRAQVEQSVLNQKRSEVQAEWLASLREEIEVENLLSQLAPDTEAPETEPEIEAPASEDGVSDIDSNDAVDGTATDGAPDTEPSETPSEAAPEETTSP